LHGKIIKQKISLQKDNFLNYLKINLFYDMFRH